MNESTERTEGQEPMYLLAAYRTYRGAYVKVCVIALVVVIGFSFIMPYTYKSSTTIMPPEQKAGAGGLSSLMQAAPISIGLGGAESNRGSLLFAEILRSRTLLLGVADTLKLRDTPFFNGMNDEELVKDLDSRIAVDTRKTGTISVDVQISTGWFPFGDKTTQAAKTAADVANACRIVLDRLNREKTVTQARRSRQYIERVIASNRALIDSLQGVQEKFQKENKIIALDEQMMAIVQNAVMVGTELAKAELELAMVQQDFQPSSQQTVLLQRKVEALRTQYDKVQRGGLVQTDGFSIPLENVPALTRTYTNLLRDLKIKEQLNAYLETQRMQELIQEAKDIPTVVELDAAVVPLKRASPSRVLMAALTLLLITMGFAAWVPLSAVLRSKKAAA